MKEGVFAAADMVNRARYPIADLRSPQGIAFAHDCRRSYVETGLCMLPEFILPEALTVLASEASEVSEHAHFCRSTHNAYLSDASTNLPAHDVAHRQEHTYVGSVPYDRLGEQCALRRLYQWDPLKDFVGAVLGKSTFHRFADPLGACSINVFVDGGEHGWHFDESEFTVTLMLQPPERGGAFEYVPRIRGRCDEKQLLERVLDGDRDGVRELPFTAGTLLIFGGRQTIHRVTRVTGERARLVPVLCYAERPGMTNSESVRELFWGRRTVAEGWA